MSWSAGWAVPILFLCTHLVEPVQYPSERWERQRAILPASVFYCCSSSKKFTVLYRLIVDCGLLWSAIMNVQLQKNKETIHLFHYSPMMIPCPMNTSSSDDKFPKEKSKKNTERWINPSSPPISELELQPLIIYCQSVVRQQMSLIGRVGWDD